MLERCVVVIKAKGVQRNTRIISLNSWQRIHLFIITVSSTEFANRGGLLEFGPPRHNEIGEGGDLLGLRFSVVCAAKNPTCSVRNGLSFYFCFLGWTGFGLIFIPSYLS